MKLSVLLILSLTIAAAAARTTNQEKYIYTFLGQDFTVPAWVENSKRALSNAFGKAKDFITGDSSVSTNIFGEKVAFRAHIPKSQKEVAKSVSRFFAKLRHDHTTRIIFVIYLNLVVMFIVYTLLFVKQIQLSKEHKRQTTMVKKHRKLEEADRKDFYARAAVIQETEMAHADILRKRAGDLSMYEEDRESIMGSNQKKMPESEKKEIGSAAHNASNTSVNAGQSVTVLSTSGSRLLGADLFSPTITQEEILLNASRLNHDNAASAPSLSPERRPGDIF
ncbi:unnamed protein product [Auanema sp. JU1783]|nr:unnamed protein product [Auanema sp. JU1783]